MSSFLQSKQWAEFQQAFGRQTFQVENKLVIKHNLPLGLSYFYSPRPYFADTKALKKFLKETEKIAQKENAIFLRLEPNLEDSIQKQVSSINSKLKILNTKYKILTSKCVQPQDTLLLALTRSEEELLSQMHQKTRYNIRLAQRHGLKIKKSPPKADQPRADTIKNTNIFYNLAIKTSKRDKFRYHSRKYYQKMLEVLGRNKMVELLIAYHRQNPIASILVLFYEDSAVYLHGASDYQYRNLMAPYLLQWQAIKEAKQRGCKSYDFWGVAPQAQTEEQKNRETKEQKNSFSVSQFFSSRPQWASWAGITRFKMGFAPQGQIIHYPDCWELIYQPFWYRIYQLGRRIK